MPVSSPEYLKAQYGIARTLGNRLIGSDFTFLIVGAEHLGLLFKGFAVPFISGGEAVEVPLPGGGAMWQRSAARTAKQSPITVMETVLGHYDQFLKSKMGVTASEFFDAKIYHGSPDQYYRVWTLRDCQIMTEDGEADSEARTSPVNVQGTLSYHYFGEVKPGPLQLVV